MIDGDRLETLLIRPQASIREAAQVLQDGGLQICLVVDDDRRLVGTVTDGDVRRALLRDRDIATQVHAIMNTSPLAAPAGTPDDLILGLMKTNQIRQIPLLDEERRVVGLRNVYELVDGRRDRDTWVLLMAGGLGTRLRPLTEGTPKPLLPVGDKPLLETIVEGFTQQGFSRFYLSVHYKADAIKHHFGDGGRWNAEIRYLEEDHQLGTAGALRLMAERPEQSFIVMNGDLLTRVNFGDLLAYHATQRSRGTMCVREYDLQVPFGVVEIEGNRIRAIDEKPVHRFFVNAGIYVLEPDLIDLVPDGTPFDMTALFDAAVSAGHDTAVFPIHEYWLDVGRLDDFDRANLEFRENFAS